jgi:cbb3-type cytochrome oxidase subunit 3
VESGVFVGLGSAIGTVAFFAFVSFAVWISYRKEKDQRDAAHQQRMKALELGHPPMDAEIERAKAYAGAAWAAGVIGLVVPIVVVSLDGASTIVAVIFLRGENIGGVMIAGWAIACGMSLVAIVRSLHTIHHLPRPSGDVSPRPAVVGKPSDAASGEFHEKRLEL